LTAAMRLSRCFPKNQKRLFYSASSDGNVIHYNTTTAKGIFVNFKLYHYSLTSGPIQRLLLELSSPNVAPTYDSERTNSSTKVTGIGVKVLQLCEREEFSISQTCT
jgi:hypothetical protein